MPDNCCSGVRSDISFIGIWSNRDFWMVRKVSYGISCKADGIARWWTPNGIRVR